MPLYFFDTSDGELLHVDEIGTGCADDDAAVLEALKGMGELAREYLPSFGASQDLAMTVRDVAGRQLLAITLKFALRRLSAMPNRDSN